MINAVTIYKCQIAQHAIADGKKPLAHHSATATFLILWHNIKEYKFHTDFFLLYNKKCKDTSTATPIEIGCAAAPFH